MVTNELMESTTKVRVIHTTGVPNNEACVLIHEIVGDGGNTG